MITKEALFAAMVESDLDDEPLSDANLDKILGEIENDSDANLKASAWFFGIDIEIMEKRAAILEFDGGMPRVTANRVALTEILEMYVPNISHSLCRWFIRNAAVVMEIAKKHNLTVDQAREKVLAYAHRHRCHATVEADMDMLLERIA